MNNQDLDVLFGLKRPEELKEVEDVHFLLPVTLDKYQKLKNELRGQGIELSLVSSYRDYAKQLSIWNAKVKGERPLLDRHEKKLQASTLDRESILEALLFWSAIPGLSRHHYGCDFDVFDAQVKPRAKVELTQKEFTQDFTSLNHALTEELLAQFGLSRPYSFGSGFQQSEEPWHLSDFESAEKVTQLLHYDLFIDHIKGHPEIELSDIILSNADYIFKNYVNPT